MKLRRLRELCAPDPVLSRRKRLSGGAVGDTLLPMLSGGGADDCDFGVADRLKEITGLYVSPSVALRGGGGDADIPLQHAEYVLNGGAHLVEDPELRDLYLFFANHPRGLAFTGGGGATSGMRMTRRGREAHLQIFEASLKDGDHVHKLNLWADAQIRLDELLRELKSGGSGAELGAKIDRQKEEVSRLRKESRLTIPMLMRISAEEDHLYETLGKRTRLDTYRCLALVRTGQDVEDLRPGDTVKDLDLPMGAINSQAQEAEKELAAQGLLGQTAQKFKAWMPPLSGGLDADVSLRAPAPPPAPAAAAAAKRRRLDHRRQGRAPQVRDLGLETQKVHYRPHPGGDSLLYAHGRDKL